MAKTYYAYQPTDPQAQVNWAEVGANFSNILKAEREKRDAQVNEINEQTREFLKNAENIPQGESTSIREWGLKYSGDLTEAVRLQQQLLKSGDLSMTDYLTGRQNLVDGTDQAFTLMQEYQDVYAKKMERMKSTNPDTSSQQLEVWLMENAEGFANFNRSQLVPDPRTGKVSVAMKVKDPKTGLMTLSQDPNDRRSVSALRGQLLGEFNQYNIESATKEWVDGNGKWSQIIRDVGSRTDAGVITTILNPMEKLMTVDGSGKRVVDLERARALGVPEEDLEAMNLYLQAEDDWITGQAANPLTVSSVLTENAGVAPNGKTYTFTYDAEQAAANPEMILLDPTTNEPQFLAEQNPNGPEQEEVFRQHMRNAIRNKHNVTQDVKTVNDWQRANQPTAAQVSRGQKDKDDKNILSNVAKLYYGDDADVQEASDFLRSINPNIDYIDRNGDDIIINYKDGTPPETRKWKGEDGTLLDQTAWVTANANFFLPKDKKIGNINTLVKQSGIDLTRQFNPNSIGFSAGTQETQEGVDAAFKRVILEENPISPAAFVADDRDATLSNIQGFIKGTPGLANLAIDTGSGWNDTITLSTVDDKGKKTPVYTIDLDNLNGLDDAELADAQARMLTDLVNFASTQADVNEKGLVIQGKRKTTQTTRQGRGRPTNNGQGGGGSTPNPNGVGGKYNGQ